MHNFSERYKNCKAAIRELSLQTQNKIAIAFASIGLAALIMIGPIVILVNCFIFNDYFTLVLIGLIFCLYGIILLSRVFYYLTITKKQVEDMHLFFMMDAVVCAIALCIGIFVGLYI